MKQSAFEARFGPDWEQLSQLLGALEAGGSSEAGPRPEHVAALPERYRAACQHLALARHRAYSAALIDRLNGLAVRAHEQLYGNRPAPWAGLWRLVLSDFPAKVREEWRLMLAATVLFYGPLLFCLLLCATEPENIYLSTDPMQVAQIEWMYDPASDHWDEERASSGDLQMFGFYIRNNIGIALRTFGMGLLLGVGSAVTLVFNGISIGSTAGYLTGIGFGREFWPFVVGHGSFELTAIVIAGGAGLKVGLSVLRPGRKRRAEAFRDEARDALVLVAGFSAMLFVAAILEAFWSSSRLIPPEVKFPVGAALWLLVFAWLGLGGRSREP